MKANLQMKRRRAASGGAVADLMLAPAVVMLRLPVIAAEAGGMAWHDETMRAISEKVAATAEGLTAAQLSMANSIANFWPELMAGQAPSVLNGVALERSMHAALRPAGRRVKANFRRLVGQ